MLRITVSKTSGKFESSTEGVGFIFTDYRLALCSLHEMSTLCTLYTPVKLAQLSLIKTKLTNLLNIRPHKMINF